MASKRGPQLLNPETDPSSFTYWDFNGGNGKPEIIGIEANQNDRDEEIARKFAEQKNAKGNWRQIPDSQSERPQRHHREQNRYTSRSNHASSDESESDNEECGTFACHESRQGNRRRVSHRRNEPSREGCRKRETSNCCCLAKKDNAENMQMVFLQQQMQNQMMMQNLYQQFQIQLNQAIMMHRNEVSRELQLMKEIQQLTTESSIKDVKLELVRDRMERLEDNVRNSQQSGPGIGDILKSFIPVVCPLINLGKKLF